MDPHYTTAFKEYCREILTPDTISWNAIMTELGEYFNKMCSRIIGEAEVNLGEIDSKSLTDMEISSGILYPNSCIARMAPMAMVSLSAKSALGRGFLEFSKYFRISS